MGQLLRVEAGQHALLHVPLAAAAGVLALLLQRVHTGSSPWQLLRMLPCCRLLCLLVLQVALPELLQELPLLHAWQLLQLVPLLLRERAQEALQLRLLLLRMQLRLPLRRLLACTECGW